MRVARCVLAVLAMAAWVGCGTEDAGSPLDAFAGEVATGDADAPNTPDPGPGTPDDCPGGTCPDPDTGTADPGTPDVPDVPGIPVRNYLIVVGAGLEAAAAELAAYRTSTGYGVETVRVEDLVAGDFYAGELVQGVRDRIREMRKTVPGGGPFFVTLVGDDLGYAGGGRIPAGSIPALECDNDYGDCYTDNTYADLEGDGLPDVSLGRIPARTPEEVRIYLDKVKAFESSYRVGVFNRQVSLYTGQANFGPDIDALLETAVMEGLKAVSHAFDIVGAYDLPTSPYYYAPFEQKVRDLFNDGALMVVYVGHGSTSWTEGLDDTGIDEVHCDVRAPHAFFFACYNGNFVDSDDGLADLLTWKPDGPVTLTGSMDVSHPYGNAVLAYELQRVALDLRPATVGEVFLQTKLASMTNDDEFRQMVDGFAVVEVPVAEQPLIRQQHLDLYNLVGDPAVPMRYPQGDVTIDPIPGTWKDGSLTVKGSVPGFASGTAWVTFECERDVILDELESPGTGGTLDSAKIRANWAKAINKVVTGVEVPVANGRFEATLTWDREIPVTDYYVKVYADDGASKDAFGFVDAP